MGDAEISERREPIYIWKFLALVVISCLSFHTNPVHGHGSRSTQFLLLRSWKLEFFMPSAFSGYHQIAAASIKQLEPHGRMVLQQIKSTSSNSGGSAEDFFFRPLAPRDNRIDPLNDFHKYQAGYDLQNKHYWASVIFTGVYGYGLAVLWLATGLVLSLVVCCHCMCSSQPRFKQPRPPSYYWMPRIIVFILSLIAIGSAAVLFLASREFNTQAYNVEDVIVAAADNATASIHTVSATFSGVQSALQTNFSNFVATLNSTATDLDNQASFVQSKLVVNKKSYKEVIHIIELVLIVIVSVNLGLIVCGFASTFFRWRRFFYLVIVIAWIMTTLTWAMFGLFLTIDNVASDTCLAVQQYLNDPRNTTLDALLPCTELATIDTAYKKTRAGMDNLIHQVIGPFVCDNSSVSVCNVEGKNITQSQNASISTVLLASQNILDVFPTITGLLNCSFVTNTLSILVKQRCAPAKTAILHIWISFVVLSSVMILLIIFWVLANVRNSNQRYLASILPQEETMRSRPFHVMPK
ncbi:hypothetical protein CY35_01G071400 [Sphagnum magellanicum]|nr:hypothetical protein CY35_01G071400 [Sphagnum magellanicum]